jgi:hypothetical protein
MMQWYIWVHVLNTSITIPAYLSCLPLPFSKCLDYKELTRTGPVKTAIV